MRWTPLLLVASLAGAPAGAATPPRRVVGVVVLPDADVAPRAARRLQRATLRAFRDDPAVMLVDPLKALTDRPLGLEPATRALLEQGVEALGRGQARKAAALLRRADGRAHASLSTIPKAALAEIAVHLAAALQGAGKRGEALRALEHLLSWRPQHGLRLRVAAPPGWRETVARARQWLSEAPPGTLRVDSVPPGAEVFIDGRRAGPTPRLLANLTAGPHYLTLQLPGYRRSVTRVEAPPGREDSLSVRLHPDEPAHSVWEALRALRPELGRETVEVPPALSTNLGLSSLLLVRLRTVRAEGGDRSLRAEASLYGLESGKLLGRTALAVGPRPRPEQVAALALWRPDRPMAAPPPPGTPTPTPRRRGGRWYESWWVWGVVGAVCVAGVAVAVPLALTAGDDEPHPAERYHVSW